MHIVEPRLDRKSAYSNYLKSWENHGSAFEEVYLFKELPNYNGELRDYLIQLFEPQRSMQSMISGNLKLNEPEIEYNFYNQHVDFACHFPYHSENEKRGICIEIDGITPSRSDFLFKRRGLKSINICPGHICG